ncbi:hypothetical protein [Flammeovirga pacifica]|uniref:SbsA Ig-like domain-containing protein n=1 Tax=Flammeovirga pacifica TaxID=915059 RepID=A0A1S1Z2J2_FLAPC|nr:hypothetical protein [Flammeovirga pacifica]OHX67496.1 hypothetical protein NH26_14645 [Flammeovirga pacifica]
MKKTFIILLFIIGITNVFASVDDPISPAESKSSKFKFKKFRSFDVELPKEESLENKENFFNDDKEQPVSKKIANIRGALKKVKENKLFTSVFSEADLISLPVGIPKKVGNTEFIIVIDKVRLTPRGTLIDVGLVIDFPNSDQQLVFGAFDVAFSQERGFGGLGKLALLNNFEVNLSKDIRLNFKGTTQNGQTFVNWGCDGYQDMALDFEVIFNKDLIRPCDAEGNPIPKKEIIVPVTSHIETFDELIVAVNLPRFRMGEDHDRGFIFEASDVVYDQSETRNANIQFPENYHSTEFLEEDTNLWKGFYIRYAEVTMPSDFDKVMYENHSRDKAIKEAEIILTDQQKAEMAKSDSTALANASKHKTSFQVSNLIIDDYGLTANFQGHQLLSLEQGNLGGGWGLSLVHIEVEILKGQFIFANMSGDLQVPITDDNTLLAYVAEIRHGGDFHFYAENRETLPFAPFGDQSELLLDNTIITIELTDGIFYGALEIDGSMSVKSKDSSLELADIDFQGLLMETRAPYISVVAFGASSEAIAQKLSGKNLTINEIGMSATDGNVSLNVDATISLHSGSEGFGGGGAISVWAYRDNDGWKYNGTIVSKITIEASKTGVYDIKGTIAILQDDETYGDVFIGVVEAQLGPTCGASIGMEATVMFGKKDDLNYWYIDCLAILPEPGLTVGTISFQGFGGGLYYGMSKLPSDMVTASNIESATGGVYVPDASVSFGLKAIIIFAIPKKESMLAETTFEMTFNRGGGIRYAMFAGCASIMTPPMPPIKLEELASTVDNEAKKDANGEKQEVKNIEPEKVSYGSAYLKEGNSKVFAKILVEMDFLNNSFHGELSVTINAGAIEGGGVAVVHIEEESWYLHIGTNENPIQLSFLGGVEASSYFMFGDNLPSGFKAPKEVIDILGKDPTADIDNSRNESLISDGRGVAFGAAIKFGTPDLNFLMFYADIKAGLGFDLMVKNYGAGAVCANTGRQIGINGWFAQGQIYAYIKAKIGIQVNLKFINGKFDIIDAGFAALLQFKGPNPIYAFGIVGGKFNILGGMVKGECSFEFTLGEQCIIQGASPLGGMEIIASMSPSNQSEDVDVFSAPQVVFNVPINKTMQLVDPNTNEKKSYKINVKKVQLTSRQSGDAICNVEWNEDNTTLVLQPESMLENEADYAFYIVLDFREKKGGKWVAVNSDDVLAKGLKFKSGKRPEYIDHSRVLVAYPVERMMNLHIEESDKGYLEMEQKGWDYLFEVDNPDKWEVKARFTSYNKEITYGDINYNDNQKLVSFDIPTEMKTGKIYTMDLVHLPKTSFNVDDNVVETKENVQINNGGENKSSVEITKRNSTGEVLESNEEKVFYTSSFRTSQWKTFPEKIRNLHFSEGTTSVLPGSFRFQMSTFFNAINNETLDDIEVNGSKNSDPLINIKVDFEDPHFKHLITPLMYFEYPLAGAELNWRNAESGFGWVKPTNSLYFDDNHEKGSLTLSDDELLSGNLNYHNGYRIFYNPDYFIGKDFKDFQAELEDLNDKGLLNITNPVVEKKIDLIRVGIGAPKLQVGEYHIISTYTLPGKKVPSSTFKIKMTNNIQ